LALAHGSRNAGLRLAARLVAAAVAAARSAFARSAFVRPAAAGLARGSGVLGASLCVAPRLVAPAAPAALAISVAPIAVAPIAVAPISLAPISLAPIAVAPISLASISVAPVAVAAPGSGVAALRLAPARAPFGAHRPALLALVPLRFGFAHAAFAFAAFVPMAPAPAVVRIPVGLGLVILAVAPGMRLRAGPRLGPRLALSLRRRPIFRRAARPGEAHIALLAVISVLVARPPVELDLLRPELSGPRFGALLGLGRRLGWRFVVVEDIRPEVTLHWISRVESAVRPLCGTARRAQDEHGAEGNGCASGMRDGALISARCLVSKQCRRFDLHSLSPRAIALL
jgi:hypothetical protein